MDFSFDLILDTCELVILCCVKVVVDLRQVGDEFVRVLGVVLKFTDRLTLTFFLTIIIIVK